MLFSLWLWWSPTGTGQCLMPAALPTTPTLPMQYDLRHLLPFLDQSWKNQTPLCTRYSVGHAQYVITDPTFDLLSLCHFYTIKNTTCLTVYALYMMWCPPHSFPPIWAMSILTVLSVFMSLSPKGTCCHKDIPFMSVSLEAFGVFQWAQLLFMCCGLFPVAQVHMLNNNAKRTRMCHTPLWASALSVHVALSCVCGVFLCQVILFELRAVWSWQNNHHCFALYWSCIRHDCLDAPSSF